MQQHWKALGGPGTVGIEVVLSVVVGLYGGRWLDEKFGTRPWLMLAGLAYGLAAAGRAIYRALKKANREAEQEDEKDRAERRKFEGDARGDRPDDE